MTKFKCKISDLETISRLVSSKGKNIEGKEYQAITDCLIEASEGKLTVKVMDIQRTFAVGLEYKNIDVSEAGQLPIGDLSNFTTFLQRFEPQDEVTVYTVENKIFIERESPKKVGKLPLVAVEALSSHPAPPLNDLKRSVNGFPATGKMPLDLEISIEAETFSSIFEDGNAIKERILPIKVEDDKLKISIGSEVYGSFETELIPESVRVDSLESPAVAAKTQSSFGNGLDNIFSNLQGKIKIYMGNNTDMTPLCVQQDTDKFKYIALLAPYAVGN
jgi:hypothetical protein